MTTPATLAVLDPGDAVIGKTIYDPKTREVFCVVRRADGSVTEERMPLPSHGKVQIVKLWKDQSVSISVGTTPDTDTPSVSMQGATDWWAQFMKRLKSKEQ